MKLSVVVPCLNGMPFLEQALTSILDNAKGLDVEILLQDGGSTDGSLELARSLLGPENVISEQDSCHEDAVNRGWHRTTGDVIAWLNADDLYEPNIFRVVMEAFERNPDKGWCFGHFRMIDESGNEIRKIHRTYKSLLIRNYSYHLQLVENVVPQMTVFVRRSLWKQAGDLMLHNWAFDYDYWLRLGKLSDPMIIPQTLAAFRWHPASKTGRDPKRLFRDEFSICCQHTSNPVLRLLHYLLFLRNVLLYERITW